MPKYSLDNARTVGQGNLAPPGSVTDAALASAISRYKRGVASRYTALVPDEVGARLPPGPYFVSPKIDGEQWCLVFDEGDVFFANPNGRVLAGDIPVLAEIPYVGPILLNHDYVVYISLFLVFAVWYFLRATRAGLILRSIGENHEAAHALGYKVVRVRMRAILFGGACAGLGGAYLSLVRVPQWTEGMTAGAGWIALALVVFGSWKPLRVLLGAYLFGGVAILQLNLQAVGVNIPVAYLSMAPYLITILVLVLISSNRGKTNLNAPAALGRVFHASH